MNSRRLKIAAKDHRRNSYPLISALRAAGHEFFAEGPVDLLLTDLDIPYLGHKEILDRYSEMGAKVLMYPHAGGGPNLSYDGQFEADPRVHANLVAAHGHAEYLRRIEYPSATHAIGWTHCDQRPFRACDDVKHVVFAPTHPNGDGTMTDYQRELNTTVFRELLDCPFKLTVRHVGTLEQNGLWKAKGVEFVDGRRSPQFAQIDVVDAVVAGDGTFPSLAVARGVPTVMYSQGIMCLGLPGETPGTPARPELYWDYARYPFDAADGPLEDTIREAARTEGPVAGWKRRFIGEPFDPRAFVALVERIAAEDSAPVRIDDTRSVTTLAFADELVEHPELLAAYTASVRPEDDASLILWAPGVEANALLAMAEAAIEASGIDPNRLPDILLAPLPGSPEVDAALAERADALLSEWPSAGRIGELPKFATAALFA
jgi:hypothetical protein